MTFTFFLPTSWTLWLATAFVLIIGPLPLILAVKGANHDREVAAWPTTPGQILSTDLKVSTHGSGRGGTSTYYEAKVEYKYEVDGKYFRGHEIAVFYSGGVLRHRHEMILEKLRSGTTVTVRYNPTEPDEAYLAAGLNLEFWGQILFGFWCLGICGAVYSIVLFSEMRDASLVDNLLESGAAR